MQVNFRIKTMDKLATLSNNGAREVKIVSFNDEVGDECDSVGFVEVCSTI